VPPHSAPLMIEAEGACDRAGLTDLWLASWAATYPGVDFEARRNWFEEHLSFLETQGCTTLAARDATGTLIGFVIFNQASGWLDQLAVHPAAFGTGTAHELMRQAKRASPGCLQRTGEGINPNSGARTFSMEWRQGSPPAA
jgi:putative acetyltransferase